MRFSHPEYLLLMAVVAWCWHVSRSASARSIRLHARAAAIALLVLAAAGLGVRGGAEALSVVFVLDRSDSMTGMPSIERLNAAATAARPGDQMAVVAFGGNAVVERRLSPVAPIREVASEVVASSTDIASALRLAHATLPPDGNRRIVLISDGRETIGDARAEAAREAADGVPVDVVSPGAGDQTPVRPRVVSVSAPGSVRIGDPFVVATELEGLPGTAVEVAFRRDDDRPVLRDAVIGDSGRTAAAIQDQPRSSGLHEYRVTVRSRTDDDDQMASDEGTAGAVVTVAGRASVLYVSSKRGVLNPILAANDFRIREVPPELVPSTAGALGEYDAIVLDDVEPSALRATQITAIAQHVEQAGSGLLVLGSERSLSSGDLAEGGLGSLLPVDLRPRSGRRAPAVALVIVFDKSGSMSETVGGVPKIELARRAIGKVLDVLPGTDALGVVAFDAEPSAIAPLRAGHDAHAMASRLRAVEPAGATRIAPAIIVAGNWLSGPAAAGFAKRHVLLVSDGRTSPDDAAAMEAAVRRGGFELSVVALGAESDRSLLTRLADATGGRTYFPTDLSELPLIVAREASRVAGGRVVEERFPLRASAHPIVAGLDRYRSPDLNGYVVSAPKPTAELALKSHLDDPILATWRFGLGRVGVFTADLRGSWSAGLQSWAGFSQLWVQSARWLSRASDSGALRVSLAADGKDLEVIVEAQDEAGRFLNLPGGRASVRTPGGLSKDVLLRVVAPGRYVGRLPLERPGAYAVAISARRDDSTVEERAVRGFYWSADAERLAAGADLTKLSELAAMTGGTILEVGQSPFALPRQTNYVETWPWLTLAAMLIFVGEIVTGYFRRVPSRNPRFDWRRFRALFGSSRRSRQSQAA